MNVPNDPMAEIRASFFVECEELLEALQDGLQTVEDGESDDETINVVFRAVHSIKGGAGAFGLVGLVEFAHRFETVLDQVRAGQLEIFSEALKVFFQGADHLADLVQISRNGAQQPEARTTELLELLDGLMGDRIPIDDDDDTLEIDFTPIALTPPLENHPAKMDDGPSGAERPQTSDVHFVANQTLPSQPTSLASDLIEVCYDISFTPHAELFETGNDPVLLLRNLRALGDMTVRCQCTRLPDLSSLSPEMPYLSWAITLKTAAEEAEIHSIFEFVEGLCTLVIVPNAPFKEAANDDPMSEMDGAVPPSLQKPSLHYVDLPKSSPTSSGLPETGRPLNNAADKSAITAASKSVVRVDLDRIERLVNLVGELVINQAMLSQSLEKSGLSPHSDAMDGLEEFQRLTRDIQDSVMMIRAQPVKSLFQRMSRIVRETSAAVDKDVRLRTSGETTEVDKTVIERLADPLTHMIRNAVDHGLETASERVAKGKSAQGNVSLSASHRSGRVVIEISDDGGGLDRAKILKIGVQKGLIAADAHPSTSEIDNLLFQPGFSTSSEVSDLSGRGVGMDIVRTEIQALGGRISIASEPGEGTRFTISLPLTLAVLEGMVIEVADETLVLPLNLVIETVTLSRNDVEMVRPGAHVVRLREGFVPIIDLAVELGYRAPLMNVDGLVVLLIAHEDGNRAALLIDDIIDQRQVVIKGLDESLYRAPGIAAATILGDGQIALILDPSDIINQALPPEVSRPTPATESMIA